METKFLKHCKKPLNKRKHEKTIGLTWDTLFLSLRDVFSLRSPSSAVTCDSHRGRRAVSLRMSLEKHVGDNDGGGGRKEKKKKFPQGLWGPAQQLSGCKQHHSPHVQTFKISARVMGSAWPLSGRTKHSCSFPGKVYRNGWLSRFVYLTVSADRHWKGKQPLLWNTEGFCSANMVKSPCT